MKQWVGIDLDRTLAQYTDWKGAAHIGAPIPAMVERVKVMLAAGIDVRIFTARVWHDGSIERMKEAQVAREAIQKWCQQHFGVVLRITNEKDYGMVELWDDRAIAIEPNTGQILGGRSKLLETAMRTTPAGTSGRA